MQIIKDIAAVIGCIATAITLLTTIVKPIRNKIINTITAKNSDAKIKEDIDSIKYSLIDIVNHHENTLERLNTIDERMKTLEQNVLENESDRLKSELAMYAAKCRHGDTIHVEDFLHVQEVYEKYHTVLHKNHTGTDNFMVIKQYFESQNMTNK